ncbi:hypothetical protein [Azospirillum sp. B506]|uniref:hypothetical protein n=1 Tax=Azospirillum sp. B506 TaxID=137721 RepID=UPI0011DD6E80|nr:hypothetical protein [Azospirillum sp. B506]
MMSGRLCRRRSRRQILHTAAAILALVFFTHGARALQMSETGSADGEAILLLSGEVAMSDVDRILYALRSGRFSEVWLDSPGGDSAAGYKLGRAIRNGRLSTRVPKGAVCASACVDIFLGGVVRFVDDRATIMIHPGSISRSDTANEYMYSALRQGKAVEAIQSLERFNSAETSSWIEYLTFMGASLEIVTYAAKVQHDCAIVLSRQELVYFNILNTAGRPVSGYSPAEPNVRCNFGGQ